MLKTFLTWLGAHPAIMFAVLGAYALHVVFPNWRGGDGAYSDLDIGDWGGDCGGD